MNIWWYIVMGLGIAFAWCWCFRDFRKKMQDEKLFGIWYNPKPVSHRRVSDLLCSSFLFLLFFALIFVASPFILSTQIFFLIRNGSCPRPESPKEEPRKPNKFRDFEPKVPFELRNATLLRFDRDKLPFIPESSQIIYVESSYDPTLNEYIRTNYQPLSEFFGEKKYRLCYLPLLMEDINKEEILRYRHPECASIQPVKVLPHDISGSILTYLKEPQAIQPGFIRYQVMSSVGKEEYIFSYFPLTGEPDVPLEQRIQVLGNHLGDYPDVLFDLTPTPEDEKTDANFNNEIRHLMKEIEERVNRLHQIGVSDMVLRKLFRPEEKLSRMVITRQFKIVLPDYNNMEIVMAPLPKAVFFLFLRHPDGIVFKQLMDYREELSTIYNRICNRSMRSAIEKSIADVTDPLNNSINEKCARIREAFVSCFDDALACRYYVTGARGYPKMITLPRELVTWEVQF